MQGAGAAQRELLLQPGAHLGVGAGKLHDVQGAADIQAGSADEDGRTALGEQSVDLPAGQPLVLGDVGGVGDVPDVEEVVRDTATFPGRQFGGADVHPPVQLHGVGVDDFAVEMAGQGDAQVGLSCRGGTDDGDDPRCGGCFPHRHSLANPTACTRSSYVTGWWRGRCPGEVPARHAPCVRPAEAGPAKAELHSHE